MCCERLACLFIPMRRQQYVVSVSDLPIHLMPCRLVVCNSLLSCLSTITAGMRANLLWVELVPVVIRRFNAVKHLIFYALGPVRTLDKVILWQRNAMSKISCSRCTDYPRAAKMSRSKEFALLGHTSFQNHCFRFAPDGVYSGALYPVKDDS